MKILSSEVSFHDISRFWTNLLCKAKGKVNKAVIFISLRITSASKSFLIFNEWFEMKWRGQI